MTQLCRIHDPLSGPNPLKVLACRTCSQVFPTSLRTREMVWPSLRHASTFNDLAVIRASHLRHVHPNTGRLWAGKQLADASRIP